MFGPGKLSRSDTLMTFATGDDEAKRSKTFAGEIYKAWAKDHYGSEKIYPIVHCKIKIYRFSNLDTVAMTVTVDFTLMMDWIDESIIPFGKDVNLDDHFSPYVRIHNAKDDFKPMEISTNRLQEDPKIPGHVKRTERYRCTLFVKDVNLQKYPFDSQLLKIDLKGDHISLRSANYVKSSDHGLEKKSKLPTSNQFQVPNETCPRKESAHSLKDLDNSPLSGWEIIGLNPDILTQKPFSGDVLEISVKVRRNPFGIVMISVFPLVICIILSMTSFYLEPENLSERLQITVTMLLAAAAFHQQARGNVPPNLPYTTVLDKYMLATLAIMLLQAFVHVLIASVLETDVKANPAIGGSQNAIDSLFMCHCLRDSSFPNCQLPQNATNNSSMHRFTYFVSTLVLSVLYYIIHQKGSVREVLVRSLTMGLRAIATTILYSLAALCIFVTMSFGSHPNLLLLSQSSFWSLTNIGSAFFHCLEGRCVGLTNPSLCAVPVDSILLWLLSDQTLIEIMVYFILFVHLVLWVEYLI